MTGEPLPIAQFRDRVRARVLERHPEWVLADSDEDGCAIVVTLGDNAGMRIGMTNAYGHYRTGNTLESTIDNLLAGMQTLEQIESFERYVADFTVAREHLMVQLSALYDDSAVEERNRRVTVPWQGGLVFYVVLDLPSIIVPITRRQVDAWQVALAEVVDIGIARTRARLAAMTGRGVQLAPGYGVAITIWDDDLSGYTATRAAWPDLALPALPTGDGYGVVCAPDRDFCVSLLADDLGSVQAILGTVLLTEIVKTRIGHPRPLMAPGLAFCRPDGSYEYQPITADDEAGARA